MTTCVIVIFLVSFFFPFSFSSTFSFSVSVSSSFSSSFSFPFLRLPLSLPLPLLPFPSSLSSPLSSPSPSPCTSSQPPPLHHHPHATMRPPPALPFFPLWQEYPSLSSSPIEILPSDLGRSLPDNDGSDADAAKIQDFTKTYDRDFVLGQLLFWFKQSLPEPSRALASAGRGCLVLPEPSSCYSRNLNQPLQRSYGAQQRNAMIDKMASKPQKAWPKPGDDWLWEWKNLRSFYGSPMFDAVLENRELDAEMMEWLNTRPIHFIGPFDLP